MSTLFWGTPCTIIINIVYPFFVWYYSYTCNQRKGGNRHLLEYHVPGPLLLVSTMYPTFKQQGIPLPFAFKPGKCHGTNGNHARLTHHTCPHHMYWLRATIVSSLVSKDKITISAVSCLYNYTPQRCQLRELGFSEASYVVLFASYTLHGKHKTSFRLRGFRDYFAQRTDFDFRIFII